MNEQDKKKIIIFVISNIRINCLNINKIIDDIILFINIYKNNIYILLNKQYKYTAGDRYIFYNNILHF